MALSTKSIDTLIPDIYKRISDKGEWFNDELARSFSEDIARRLQAHLGHSADRPTLRLSQMGPRCPCALWHSIKHPELAEALPPWAEVKYSFGHILEALAITLSKAAGHEVTGEQDAVEVDGIVGHRDCIIDGCIVDVKSASTFSFQKFKDGSIRDDDSFGYLDQLDGYLVGSLGDPLVRVRDRAYLLAIDKTLGHMCLYEHRLRADSIIERVARYKEIVGRSSAPTCDCKSIPDGKSGNLKLDVKASYNTYKFCCKPQLRTFLYANGPVYLTHVARVPDVPEINKHGQIIHS